MAEGAASIAGLASLAIQLAESVATLRRFYRSVRNAPDALEELVSELETITLALREVERLRSGPELESKAALLVHCQQSCERGSKRLRHVVDKFQRLQSKAKGIGQLYYAFKEKEEQTLLNDLERAKGSLAFAFQLYTEARRQADAERQIAMVTKLSHQMISMPQDVSALLREHAQSPPIRNREITSLTENDNGDNEADVSSPERGPGEMQNRGRTFRVRIPLWFTQQIWHLAATHYTGGWRFGFHTYSIRKFDSPIFTALKAKDLRKMQELFAARLASPFDCTPEGKTLVELASKSNSFAIVRYLLAHFRFPNIEEITESVLTEQKYVLGQAVDPFGRLLDNRPFECEAALLRQSLEQGNLDPTNYYDGEASYGPEGSLELFSTSHCVDLLLQNLALPLSSLTFYARFDCAVHMHSSDTIPHDFLRICGLRSVTTELATAKTDFVEISALHMALDALTDRWLQKRELDGWPEFIIQLVQQGADLHLGRAHDFATPFIRMLCFNRCIASFETALGWVRDWVSLLAVAGVDLVAYGLAESLSLREFRDEMYQSLSIGRGYCLYDVAYGPDPKDWSLEVRAVAEMPFFQQSIMPGSWRDERVPTYIAWLPDADEWMSGKWRPLNQGSEFGMPHPDDGNVRVVFRVPKDIRDLISDGICVPSAVDTVVAKTQDDHGIVALLYERSCRSRAKRKNKSKRSGSQPPLLRRRESAYSVFPAARIMNSDITGGLLDYHLCPFDGKYRQGCHSEIHLGAGVGQIDRRTVRLADCLRRRENDNNFGYAGLFFRASKVGGYVGNEGFGSLDWLSKR